MPEPQEAAPAPPPPPPEKQGFLTDVGHGFARGAAVALPEMAGQALKAFGADELGKSLVEGARAREHDPLYQVNQGGWGEAASSVVPALAAAGTALIPGVGEIAGPAIAGGLLFGGSQYTETREKGGSVGQGLAAGAIQGVGQAAMSAVGGKLLTGATSMFRKPAAQALMDDYVAPPLLGVGRTLANTLKAGAIQVPVQAAAAGGVAGVESGLPNTPGMGEAALGSVGPTLKMTALMAPFGLAGTAYNNAQKRAVGATTANPIDPAKLNEGSIKDRLKASRIIASDMKSSDPDAAAAWHQQAMLAIAANKPVEMKVGWNFDPLALYTEQPPATPQGPQQLALPPPTRELYDETQRGATAGMNEEQRQAQQRFEEATAAHYAERDAFAADQKRQWDEYEAKVTGKSPLPEILTPEEVTGKQLPGEIVTSAEVTANLAREQRDAAARAEAGVTTTQEAQALAARREAQRAAEEAGRPLPTIEGPPEQKVVESDKTLPKLDAELTRREEPLPQLPLQREEPLPHVLTAGTAKEEQRVREEQLARQQEDQRILESNAAAKLTPTEQRDFLRSLENDKPARDRAAEMSEDEMRARLKAYAEQEEAALAKITKDAPEVIYDEQGTAIWKATKEDRTKWVLNALGGKTPKALRESLVDLGPAELAARLKAQWEARGGESPNAPAYMSKLDAMYKSITGEDIRGKPVEKPAAEIPAGEVAPPPTGKEAAPEVPAGAKVEGLTEPRTEQHQKAFDSLTPDQQKYVDSLPVDQQQKLLSGVANTADIKTAEAAPKEPPIVQFRKDAAAIAADLPAVPEGHVRLWRGNRPDEVGKATTFTNDLPGIALPFHKSYGGKLSYVDVPAADSAKYEQKVAVAPGAEFNVPAEVAAKARVYESKEEIKAAAETQAVVDHGATVMGVTKEQGAKAAKALANEKVAEDSFNAKIEAVDVAVANKTMTEEQGADAYAKIMADSMAEKTNNDTQGRGIAGFSDEQLGKVVGKTAEVTKALNHIATTHKDAATREMAALFGKQLPSATIKVIENADFDGARYRPRTNTIEVGRGGMNTLTLMHETTHALTHAALDRALAAELKDSKTLTPSEQAEVGALKSVREVMDEFYKKYNKNDPSHVLALSSPHEFVSEGLNNPTIRAALGDKGWKKFANSLLQALHIDFRFETQFNKLLDASKALFGDPNRNSTEVFNNALVDRYPNSPLGAFGRLSSFLNSIPGVSTALSGASDRFTKHSIDSLSPRQAFNMHGWFTLHDHERRMEMMRKDVWNRFPAAGPAVDKVNQWFTSFRQVAEGRSSDSHKLLNDPGGTQEHGQRMMAMDKLSPKGMEIMGEMARDAVATGAHPKYKTLADAQKENPTLTQAQFDHPAAVRARAKYEQLTQISKAMEGRGATDTPLKVYEAGLVKNQLMNAQRHAQMLWGEVKGDGFPSEAGLDFAAHLRNADRTPIPVEQQLSRLQKAINGVMKESKADVQRAENAAVAEPDAQKAIAKAVAKAEKANGKPFTAAERTAATTEATNKTKEGLALAEKMRHDTMEGMQAAYEQQSKLPYYHRGREGTHFIVFDVKGGEEEWNRVGKVVDGMNRDWREMLPDGSRRVYMKFTDQLSHTEAVSKLAGLSDLFEPDSYGAGLIGERNKFAAGATPAFIRSAERRIDGLEKATDAAKDQMKQALHDLYIGQQPETSPLKNRMMADNTNGASRDTTKMYMNNMEMSNRALVNARSAMRFADVSTNLDAAMTELRAVPGADINDIRTQIGGYVNELYKKQADMQQPLEYSQTIAAMRAATGFWRLGLSPMYMLTVGLQPAQVTLPTLGAKYGYADAAMSMGRNTALAWGMLKSAMTTGWMSSKGDSLFNRLAKTSDITLEASKLRNKDGTPVLSERQLDLMDHLMDTGLINFGITQQMLRMDPNDKSIGARAARIAQTIPHYIEMSNRIVSALSGYELHYNKLAAGKDLSPAEMNRIHEEAKREAITTIRESDGDHSQVNVARQLGQRGILKQTTPLVVGFGQWSIQMSEFLARQFQRSISAKSTKEERIESLKIMGGVSAMTGAMAGALGLPFMNVATGVYNAVMQILQDEGETPPNAEEMFRHGVRSLLSTVSDDKESVNKMEEIFSRGLPRAAGFDMSSRAGFQDLLPFTGLLTNRARISDRLKDGSFDFMGPAFGAAAGVVTGLQAYKDGDYVKGNNEALPVFARNIAKAMRMSQYGYETTGSNNQIPIPVTNWDTFMQGMGATSGVKAEYNEQAYAQQVNQKILMDRHQVVMNEILRNAEHGDYQAMQQSMTRSIQFGLQQPQFRQFDVPGAMVGRAMQRAIGGMPDVGGLLLNKSQLPYYMMRQGMIPPPQQVQ